MSDFLEGSNAMSFPVLQDYLTRLPNAASPGQRIWLGEDGRARGKFFSCTLTSVFQPVRWLDSGAVAAYEAFAQSYSETDNGLSIWKLLERAASDDESVELDRLCRMLHVLNFFRQAEDARTDLYLSVHGRLLAAVDSNHGMVFRRILDSLGLPAGRIVLQLPQAAPNQGWLLHYVADNYRHNGFRIALNAIDTADGLRLLDQVQPDAIKVDARQITDPAGIGALLLKCRALGVDVLFKRVESEKVADLLAGLSAQGYPILAQGYAWDLPKGAIKLQSGHAPAPMRKLPASTTYRYLHRDPLRPASRKGRISLLKRG
jgi:EAL domain-containing protein (putative c-di-GMP-specific phosphodiesterase class I)